MIRGIRRTLDFLFDFSTILIPDFMNCKRVLCTAAVASLAFGVYAATPVFRHRFDSAKDDSGRYAGQTMSGAVLTKIGNEGIVDLGTAADGSTSEPRSAKSSRT